MSSNILHEDYVLCHHCNGEVFRTDLAVELPPTCYGCWVLLQEYGGEG
jgi:hypothetical protein